MLETDISISIHYPGKRNPMLKGHLRILVIKLLEREPKSGYRIMKELGERLGRKPSPGSIYPLLDDLKKKHLISSKKDGKQIKHTLTPEGKQTLNHFKKSHSDMLNNIKGTMKIFSTVSDSSEIQCMKKVFDSMDDHFMPFSYLNPELIDFKMTFWKLASGGKAEKNATRIRAILKDANEKLRRLK